MSDKSEQLTHLVYEASLDNSLWPELVLELTEHLESMHGALPPVDETPSISNLTAHFKRAFSISERIVDLQERENHLSAVLNTFSFGLALVDDQGAVIMKNSAMSAHPEIARLFDAAAANTNRPLLHCPHTDTTQSVQNWVSQINRTDTPSPLVLPQDPDAKLLMLPRQEAIRMGFPPKAAAVILASDAAQSDGLRAFSAKHSLSPRETDLLGALARHSDLKEAAADIGISYESARTYIKNMYGKTGCRSQVELVQALQSDPLNVLRKREITDEETHRVRRLFTLSDGRTLEYFTLGPEDGTAVIHCDALAGVSIDMVGSPDGVLEHLMRHNIRLITPCRPGGFRSDPKPMSSLRDFAPDVGELLDHLGVERFCIFAISFGAGSALGLAHELQHRIDKLVLSSAPYPNYRPPNWRDLDLFYQMSGVLGRKWPSMLRQMLPFLIRSVLQNVDRYFDRYLSKTKSPHDVEVLSHPFVRMRMGTMLAERTAAGMSGMVEENVLNAAGWDFDVADINIPVELYHGTWDNVAPIAGAEMLAGDLPQAQFFTLPEQGHYHHMTGWPWLLARTVGKPVEINSEFFSLPPV